MTRDEVLAILRSLTGDDPVDDHSTADIALIAYINDAEIAAAFDAVHKWYE